MTITNAVAFHPTRMALAAFPFGRIPAVVGATVLALILLAPSVAAQADVISSIQANFNGTAIPGGDYIWFNSVLKVSNLSAADTTILVKNSTIDFVAGSTTYHLAVPDAQIFFPNPGTSASTSFSSNEWMTTISRSVSGKNAFQDGLAFQVPSGGLPGGIQNVTWSGEYFTDQVGVTLNWQWAAAVYSSFDTDMIALDVKSTDDNMADLLYQSSDHSGTPESFRDFVVGGARGGGGSNFTGSYSGTANVTPGPVPEPATLSLLALGTLLLTRRRARR